MATDAPQTPSRTRRRPRSLRLKLLFAGVILGGGLLLAEGLARLVAAEPVPALLDHPYLRRVRNPELPPQPQRSHLHPDEPFVVGLDGYGYRSDLPPPGTPKGQDELRVFFVGASTTENAPLRDEETFSELVEDRLQEALGSERVVQAVNTGISGNLISDSFSLVTHQILALEPDVVVVMHAINDLRHGLTQRFDPAWLRSARGPPEPDLSDVLRRHSRLLQLYRRAKIQARGRTVQTRFLADVQATPLTPPAEVDFAPGLAQFGRYLDMLAASCAAADVPLVLMTQPTLYRPDLGAEEQRVLWMGYLDDGRLNLGPETLREGMALMNERVREAARRHDLVLVELAGEVPQDLEHFYDDCHATARGNAVMAERIAASLAAERPWE